ncbi:MULTISPECIES: hypothetical protein [Streptomyces]|uniref:Uncharacterized protein n=1 Tax=Streptomyces lycii TaxID=2654337 RepID=A0ABQ7FHS4_9ACTN|nr:MULTISPECIES: hypothetical protein [Streptomyces]KAF4408205.1 hypothetical protein GCU69_15280 [Streptomyces lycii]PGH46881.1 hypothetical protein CRI70_31610 [Streptomyces sp. Ru87]
MRTIIRTAYSIALTGLVLSALAVVTTDGIDWPQQQVVSASTPGDPGIDWPQAQADGEPGNPGIDWP